MKPSIKFTSPELTALAKKAKESKSGTARVAHKISSSKLKLEVAGFQEFDYAIKKEATVYLVNPKKGTSLRGKLIKWVDQDEGKETAIFRQLFKKRFIKVQLGQIYVGNERA